MDTALESLKSIATFIIGTGGDVVTFVTGHLVLMIPFGFGVIGGAVGLVKKFKR